MINEKLWVTIAIILALVTAGLAIVPDVHAMACAKTKATPNQLNTL